MAYSYSRTITIDPAKVGGSNLTNYPVMFAGTYSWLATVANGGKVTSASGYDIRFFSDEALTVPLKFERDTWAASTGACVFWIKVPTVSATVATVIYLAYGDSSITTDQSDKVNVWDANFLNVYHFGDGSSLSLTDSTSNGYTWTNLDSSATAGKLGGAINFDGVNDTMGVNTPQVSSPASITVQWWNYVASGDQKNSAVWFYDGFISTTNRASAHVPFGDSNLYWDFGNPTAAQGRAATSYAAYLSAWTLVSLVFNDATDFHAIYLNGALVQSHTHASSSTPGKFPLTIGRSIDNIAVSVYHKGKVDEFRISNVARSGGWILADYNNQNSPSTFYAVGAEVGGSPAAAGHTAGASQYLTRKRRRENLQRQFGSMKKTAARRAYGT